MKIDSTLNNKLSSQKFICDLSLTDELERCCNIAAAYAFTENAIAVLSDLKEGKSYIYYGGAAETLGLAKNGSCEAIQSIWEKDIFKLIPNTEMEKRNLDELQFFHFIQSLPKEEHGSYFLQTCIRMENKGNMVPVMHRITYIGNQPNGTVWLALCLYNIVSGYVPESYICNSKNGSRFVVDRKNCGDILTEREKEILRLIEEGRPSKEIADKLFISIHTISRHRQNILQKLKVQNSFEACKTAKLLNLI